MLPKFSLQKTKRQLNKGVGMGMGIRWKIASLAVLILGVLACAAPPPPPPVEVNTGQAFSSERAWQHLLALSAMGPRVAGTDGGKQAYDYIWQQVQDLGLDVVAQEATITRPSGPVTLRNIVATIPGASPDLFLLSTHYDTHPMPDFPLIGTNEGASGVAVLLELARVYAASPLPYTVQISFIDGDMLPGDEAKSLTELLPGSNAWAEWLQGQGLLANSRFALVLDQVSDRDLVFSRDLFSNRQYRETFWNVAHELGYSRAFPPTAKFESIGLGHRILDSMRMRSSVALADTHYGEGDAPGSFWRAAGDTPENNSQASLEIIGRVSLVAIERIAQRLQKIDSLTTRATTQESVDSNKAAPPATSPTVKEAPAASSPPAPESSPPSEEPAGEAVPATPVTPAVEEQAPSQAVVSPAPPGAEKEESAPAEDATPPAEPKL